MFVAEPLKLADIVGQVFGRNGRVLNEGNGLMVALHAHQESQPGLSHTPDGLLPVTLSHLDDGARPHAAPRQLRGEVLQTGLDLSPALTLVLRDQDAVRLPVHERFELSPPRG